MIVGLIIYTATVERQREYGVMKAIGAKNRVLYQVVLTQALFASISGASARDPAGEWSSPLDHDCPSAISDCLLNPEG